MIQSREKSRLHYQFNGIRIIGEIPCLVITWRGDNEFITR